MWPDWLKSSSRTTLTPPPSPRSTRFSCSSFKDINTLFTQDPDPNPNPDNHFGSPKKPSIFHRVRSLRSWAHRHTPSSPPQPVNDQTVITLYFTSLRIVRRTFEDCRTVRSILRGFRVPIDERDLSMDNKYVDELQGFLGSKRLALPIVLIGGKCIGGAERVKEMHESGELKRLIGTMPFWERSGGCDECGGLRFVLCDECNGSHKIYVDKFGFRTCLACNANGLIRCSSCFPLPTHRMSALEQNSFSSI